MIACFSLLGGIFLIIGAFYLSRGDVFISVGAYFIADVCWVLMALSQHAYMSAIVIVFGMICGLYVFWKMHRGEFRKSIKKENP